MMADKSMVILQSDQVSVVISTENETPTLAYFGRKLTHFSATMLRQLTTRQEVKCAVVKEAPIALSPSLGQGFTGAPGIEIIDEGQAWSVVAKLVEVVQSSDDTVRFVSVDPLRNIRVIHTLTLDPMSHVLVSHTELVNESNHPLIVHWCAAPTLTIPDNFTKITSFEGRWSNEFQRQPLDLFLGSFVRENRRGKTSHDTFPAFLMHQPNTTEQQGEVYGFHLGWSGNHKMRAELMADGRSYVQLGELLMPSEVTLNPDESYQSPLLYAAYSSEGFTGLSENFHRYVRQHLLTDKVRNKPRPIHYNTWEGIYFDHDVTTLMQLADKAANAGAERFVLDDGWFKGRRNDRAGLGDWVVDTKVYPEGLTPLIKHVNDLGMEFGIWFEPEMVNPDSDLYREHPDWILSTAGTEQLNFRHQCVLDLTRTEVVDYLFNQINDVLTQYPQISYIKWDMNRDINHQGNYLGKPAVHQQILNLYQLIDRVKAAHPHLEIESCCSGGGRADFGILAHTDRIWTSDSNDALARLSIQRGFSYFLPAEVMGSHVGPRDCHITGRHISIEMRAAVAFFGHMGMEMDPRELTADELSALQHMTQLYKQYRSLIHQGKLYRLDDNGMSVDFGVVSQDKQRALFAYNNVKETPRTNPPRYRFVGLQPETRYQLSLIWPTALNEYSPSVLGQVNGKIYCGEALMQIGMQLPMVFPQTTLIFSLEAKTN
jgi:alpha-galactosidase